MTATDGKPDVPPGTWLHYIPVEYKAPFVETMAALGNQLPDIEHIFEGVFRGKNGFPGKALPPAGHLRYVWIPVINMAIIFGIVILDSNRALHVFFEIVSCESDDPSSVLSAIPRQRLSLVQKEARDRCLLTEGMSRIQVFSTVMRLVVPREEG